MPLADQTLAFDAPIDAEAALREASTETGLDDFGDPAFLAPYRAFVAALNASPLHAEGRAASRASIHRRLVNRLRLQRDLTAHPEILDEDVSDPLVILGLARTGTTALQRMLSADARIQGFAHWKVINPMPIPAQPGAPDPRIAIAEEVEAFLRERHPDFFAAHPLPAHQAEEDAGLHDLHFQHVLSHVYAPRQDYLDTLRALPRDPPYAYARTVIQHLQWQDGGKRERRWAMKSPGHLGYVDAILASHPKAIFICSERALVEVLPSYCGLIEAFQRMYFRTIDRNEIGRLALDFWAFELRRYRETRARLGDRMTIVTVAFREMVGDPIGTIAKLYDAAGMVLTPTARAQIEAWIAENPPHRFGTHRYALEDYGLTRERIEAALG